MDSRCSYDRATGEAVAVLRLLLLRHHLSRHVSLSPTRLIGVIACIAIWIQGLESSLLRVDVFGDGGRGRTLRRRLNVLLKLLHFLLHFLLQL